MYQNSNAAKVEGASAWRMFRKITFPLLMPTTLFVLINALLNAFKLVDHLFSVRNAVDPADAYLLFRGNEASIAPLMRDRGFPVPEGVK